MSYSADESRRVKRACEGDANAFGSLADEHYRAVYAVAFSTVGNWSAAQDIAQETFLLAWSRRTSLRDAVAFPAWVRRIAANLAKNWLRSLDYRRRLAAHYQLVANPEMPPHTSADVRVDAESRNAEVWRGLETLAPELRQAIVMHYFYGEPARAVAAAFGISEETARKRLQRGRAKLRAHFDAQWKKEMAVARETLGARSPKERFLAGLVLGPAVPGLGKTAAGTGLRLWWEVAKQSAWAQKTLVGVAAMSAKKAGFGVLALVLVAIGSYCFVNRGGTRTPEAPEHKEAAKTPDAVGATRPAAPERAQVKATASTATSAEKPQGAQLVVASSSVSKGRRDEGIVPMEIADPKRYLSLHGMVVDAANSPVAGAAVSVVALGLPTPSADWSKERVVAVRDAFDRYSTSREHYWQTTSGGDGAFAVSGIRFAGSAIVAARAPGYTTGTGYALLKEGVEPDVVTIQMQPGVTIRGRLLDSAGQPVGDGAVLLTGFTTETRSQGGSLGAAAFTNAKGEFDLDVPGPGSMSLKVDSPTRGPATFSNVIANPDEVTELRYPKPARVYGHVKNDAGKPVADAEVTLDGTIFTRLDVADGGSGSSTTSTGATYKATSGKDGAFSIEAVDPGQRYTTTVYGKDGVPLAQGPDITDMKPGADVEINLLVLPGMVVQGTVYGIATGKPLPDISVVVAPSDVSANPSYRPAKGTSGADGAYRVTVTGKAGAYSLRPGYGRFGAVGGGSDVTSAVTVELKPGTTTKQDLRAAEPISRTYRLVDADGAPVPGAGITVQIRAGSATTGYGLSNETAADGRVDVTSMPPNVELTVMFSKTGYLGGKGAAFVGEPGAAYPEETVAMYRAAGLVATLVTADGKPIADQSVTVVARDASQSEQRAPGHTDGNGTLVVGPQLPATTVTLEFRTQGAAEGRKVTLTGTTGEVTLNADESANLGTITLGPQG